VRLGAYPGEIGVLFPEPDDSRHLLLQAREGDLVLRSSPDLRDWSEPETVALGRPLSWDEVLSPGPPPVRVSSGWLTLVQGAYRQEDGGLVRCAGSMLLDGAEPARLLGRGRDHLLEPVRDHELQGLLPHSVAVSGWYRDPRSDHFRVSYTAAGLHLCLATIDTQSLLAAAVP